MGRLGLAFRCFFRVLGGKPLPEEALRISGATTQPLLPPPAPALPPTTAAVQLLALLQKEGRLLDFLQEEIDSYDDAQVGAAVRNIHSGCRRALAEHVGLQPVLTGEEDSPISVPEGFDPSRIRLIGNVTGEPPFSGVLRHHGWRAASITLPQSTVAQDPTVIAAAEVELP